MKKLLLLILSTLCSYNAQSQIKLKPKWTTGFGSERKEVFFNNDATRMITANGYGVSLWNVLTGEVIYNIANYSSELRGVAVNKDFSLVAFVTYNNPGPGMIIKVCDITTGDSVAFFNYPDEDLFSPDLTFNNDGTKLALGEGKGDVIVWDLNEKRQICSVKVKDGSERLKFIESSNRVISTDIYGGVKIIDVDKCMVVDSLRRAKNYATTSISPDGSRVIIYYITANVGEPNIVVINSDDLSAVKIPEELRNTGFDVAKFNKNGTKVVLIPYSPIKLIVVQIWDLLSGEVILKKQSRCETNVGILDILNAEFNESEDKFVLSGANGITELYDLKSGSVISFEGNHKQTHRVSFMGGSNKIITSSDDGMMIEWNMETQKAHRYFFTSAHLSTSFNFLTSDEKYVVATSVFGPVALIDKNTGKLHKFLLPSFWLPYGYQLKILPCKSPNEVLVLGTSRIAKRLNTTNSEVINEIRFDNKCDTVYRYAEHGRMNVFHNYDNNQIIVAYGSQTDVHNAMTGELLFSMKGHLGEQFGGKYYNGQTDYVYSTKNNKIMTGGTDDKLRVWSATTGELLHTFESSSNFRCLAYSPNQDIMLIGDIKKREVEKWDLNTMTLMQTFSPFKKEGEQPLPMNLEISSNEALIAISIKDEFCVLDFLNGDVIWRCILPEAVSKVKISDNSDMIAVGGYRGKIYIYDVHSATLKYELSGHNEMIYSMQFSNNDSTLLTGASDGTIKCWNLWGGDSTIRKPDIQDKVQIRYTNPAQNELQLFTGQSLSHDAEYCIINNLGVKVFSGFLKSGSDKYTIPLHSLQRGLYFLQTNINDTIQHNKILISE